jgi:hypothetical protein
MADMGAEGGTFLAKAGAAGAAGALWGIFGTMLLVIPTMVMGLLSPLAKKANKAVSDRIDSTPIKAEAPVRESKSQRDHQRRLAALEAEREEQELRERLEALNRRKARRSSQGAGASVHTI